MSLLPAGLYRQVRINVVDHRLHRCLTDGSLLLVFELLVQGKKLVALDLARS
ncbi:hypothetical protein H6F86_01170 [Phormidium sp. FACHB-592]|uniref:Uncharacterized protein n=1 Tax=Stenomitos frigidus AS-A4 TaxID=2933935 RepID=A0ABV0KQH1_9CYAN|nr:hypothetical protein [Phormidium sp. FACHB-592]MBD2072546.1 hypothetical protein [Phormidium sp. FACHB-592]